MKKYFALVVILLFSSILWAEQTIGIFTVADAPWDPDSKQTGITGSEEAVIYLSDELVRLGYKVTVIGMPPEGSSYSLETANPRYVLPSAAPEKFDIAICWRMPQRALELKPKGKKLYLWPHDSCFMTLPPSYIDAFDDVFWLSKWQREQWISVNPGFAKFTTICGNGINPAQFRPIEARTNPHSCIYGSNYAWGLEYLLDIWPSVLEHYPQATLDIYYGWQHWGFLSPEQEQKMKKQIADLGPRGVTEHGRVGHEELNRAYERASLWSYPCMVNETFCISALRAQGTGCIPVIIQGSALKETVRHGHQCDTQAAYLDTLLKAMAQAERATVKDRQDMSDGILRDYAWQSVAEKWHDVFVANQDLKKFLVLIIASDNHPAYGSLESIWRAYMHNDREHVEAYFLKGDPNLDVPYVIKGDTIYTKVQDSYKPGILEKTIRSMECVQQMGKKYDYLLRTNLSSFYVFDRLQKHAKKLPSTNCYAALALLPYYDVPQEYQGIPFGSGSGFLLSPDLVELLVQHKDEVLQRASDVPDDVLVGAFLYKQKVPLIPTGWCTFQTKEEWDRQKHALPEDAFHFRAKSHYSTRQASDNYSDELIILCELLQKFYPPKICPPKICPQEVSTQDVYQKQEKTD